MKFGQNENDSDNRTMVSRWGGYRVIRLTIKDWRNTSGQNF